MEEFQYSVVLYDNIRGMEIDIHEINTVDIGCLRQKLQEWLDEYEFIEKTNEEGE